jgi:Spy/CpxP family protein refolding chaperone
MHPYLKSWRCARRAFAKCGGYGPWGGRGHAEEGYEEGLGAGGFGVRRPLRFLAHQLDLDERQVGELARILDELKTERAQAEVDRRRTVAAFADALTGDAFDAAKAAEGGDLRVKSAERLRTAVIQALQRIHAVLNPDQRGRLAYLIRTGTLAL